MDALDLSEKHLRILRRLSTEPSHVSVQLPDDLVQSQEMQDLSVHGFVEISPFGAKVRYILTDVGNDLMCQRLSLAERIAYGRTTLLDTNKICARLNITRITFERWQRNATAGMLRTTHFPKPDIYIGKSPRWELSTFIQWLIIQTNKEFEDGQRT